MATAPVKQLHNFPLSLRWGTQTQPPYCPAPPDSGSDSDPESNLQQSTTRPLHPPPPPPPPPRVGSRSARLHRFSFNSCTTSSSVHKPNKSHKLPPSKRQVIPGKPKAEGEAEGEEEEENSFRPWKLRPRNKNGNHNNNNGVVSVEVKEPTHVVPVAPEPKSMRLRGIAESLGGGGNGGGNGGVVLENKKEKRKVWIALSREEIEEDVFSMTGSRPSRRPRKRPKNIQKLLDSVFPGLWLVGTTADSYRLAETPVRR